MPVSKIEEVSYTQENTVIAATHLSNDGVLEGDDDLVNEDVVEVGPEPVESGWLVVPLELPGADVSKDESFLPLRLVDGQELLKPVKLS